MELKIFKSLGKRILLLIMVVCSLSACSKDELGLELESLTVSFSVDGGTSIEPQLVEQGGIATKPADPSKDGFEFLGWYSDESLTSLFDFSTKLTESITLYAKWDGQTSVSVNHDYSVAVVKFHLSNTEWSMPEGTIENLKTLANEVYGELSYGNFSISNMDVFDMGAIPYTREEISENSQTSKFISEAHNGNPGVSFNELKVIAQRELDKLVASSSAANKGISITSLNTSILETLPEDVRARAFDNTSLALYGRNIPSSLNRSNYDVITFVMEDDELHGGGGQGSFRSEDGFMQNDIVIADGSPYFVAGATEDNYSENNYTASPGDGRPKITQFARVFLHELVHALGVATHDCGLAEASQDKINSFNDNSLDDFFGDLGYGDYTSLMGTGAWGSGLAPSTREFLRWIESSRIKSISSSTNAIQIKEINQETGLVIAKIPVTRGDREGFLYVTYSGGTGYQSELTQIASGKNTKGVLIHYADKVQTGSLTTSVLVDADGTAGDNVVALLPGNSYSYLGVVISNVSISGLTATFNVQLN